MKILSGIASPALTLFSFVATATAAPPEVPGDLKVDGPVIAIVHAKGFQIYVCDADSAGKLAWKLKEPSATFSGDGIEGTHFAGPTWKSTSDGSSVKGKKVREHPPATPAKDVPMLLVQATDHDGAGKLADVTFIQRLNTSGGVAPSIGDARAGDTTKVAYTADYVFYGRGATTRPSRPLK